MNVFPYIGSYGYSGESSGFGFLRVYPDLGFRFYKRSNSDDDRETLIFKSYTQAKLDTIRTFFKANRFNNFYVYSPGSGALVVDPTGVSTTGRRTAIFYADSGAAPKMTWSSVGRCFYDIQITVQYLS